MRSRSPKCLLTQRESSPTDPGFTLDHRTLAAYEMIASQIAEMFRGYETGGVARERQMVIALAVVVKLTVENFILHQRLIHERQTPPGG